MLYGARPHSIEEVPMRVVIAAVGFAALAYVFCCQNAGAVSASGTAIRQAGGAGLPVAQTRFYVRGYRKCYRQLVVGSDVCRRYWL
jgi:hypothetical protein